MLMRRLHLWDYCRNTPDRDFLRTLSDPALGVEVISPPASDASARFPNKWKGYYAHYATLLKADDFLIKCDDDVVFIANLPVLLRVARRDAGAHLLYFPSIVNNDVAASFQAADGIITDPEYVVELHASAEEGRYSRRPVSDWYNCTACAEHVHSAFLRQPSRFFTGCIHKWGVAARVPINFFVMAGSAVQKHFAAYANEQVGALAHATSLSSSRRVRSPLPVGMCPPPPAAPPPSPVCGRALPHRAAHGAHEAPLAHGHRRRRRALLVWLPAHGR
jgi:hypothetical protein